MAQTSKSRTGQMIKLADHDVTCPSCGKDFRPQWSYVERRWSYYCDRRCYLAAKTASGVRARTKKCIVCAATFETSQVGARRTTANYCSLKCKGEHRSGSNHPGWKGGRFKSALGYVWLFLTKEEMATHTCSASSRGHIQEHIARAEAAMGRCLKKGEVVHHINADKTDNRNTNLLVCSQSYHASLHHEMSRRYAQEKFGGR